MNGYLGEFDVDVKDTPYKKYTSTDWAKHFIMMYGGIDGGHHKQWVLDVVVRILSGCKVTIREARWDNNGEKEQEYRFTIEETSKDYQKWLKEYRGEWDKENECWTYEWDNGISP